MPRKKSSAAGHRLFGEALKKVRQAAGKSAAAAAKDMGVGKTKYLDHEHGLSALPEHEKWGHFRRVLKPALFRPGLREALDEADLLYRVEEAIDRGVSVEEILDKHKHLPFDGPGWRCALSLQEHPDLEKGSGWPAASLRVRTSGAFRLPDEHLDLYKAFREDAQNVERFRLFDDNAKFMLVRNPSACTDSKTLQLEFKTCRWSEVIYYQQKVLLDPTARSKFIRDIVQGSGLAPFPHGSGLHLLVVTVDNELLLCKRSSKGYVYNGLWSSSGEEGLSVEDFGSDNPLLDTGRRLLSEELGLEESHYKPNDMRILSVFLEAEPPVLALCFCGCVRLQLTRSALSKILKHRWKAPDRDELVQFDYLPLAGDESEGALIRELLRPAADREYHPTSGYRMLMLCRNTWGKIPSADWLRAALLTN